MRHHSIFSGRTEPFMVMLFMFVTMLAGMVVLAGTILASSIVSAEGGSTVAQVGVTVPAICTMTGTGMDSHNAEIVNGTYVSNIGITTLHAFCNDNEGFAIYAAGYTGNEIGGESSNKLVGTTASSNATIVSGIATAAGNPDVSNWAMKLAITQDSGDTTGTNAFTIDSAPNVDLPSQAEQSASLASFSEYHVVPNEYVKVAHKNSMTDMTATTGGVKLTTTYAAYVSKTQPADTYTGQVIYTLVHPANVVPVTSGQIGVNYHANGSSFSGGGTTNQVVYTKSPMYIASTPQIAKSPNVADDGTQNGPYPATDDSLITPITVSGADKMKVVIRYGLSESGMIAMVEGEDDSSLNYYVGLEGPRVGTETYIFNGDTVTFRMDAYDTPTSSDGQDYGFYAEVYPVFETEREGTMPDESLYSVEPLIGSYEEPVDMNGVWYTITAEGKRYFVGETQLTNYLGQNEELLFGRTVDLYAYDGLVMQDIASWKDDIALEEQVEALDIRDEKKYMVAKLADGNIWMTQNLDLCIGCDGVTELTSENTDLGVIDGGEYHNGYSRDSLRNIITWEPVPSAITSRHIISGDTVSLPEESGAEWPYSAEAGDLYVYTSGNGSSDIVYTSKSDCELVHSDGTCQHYHVGNYYNEAASIASNDTDRYYGETLLQNSICPAGWRLPDQQVSGGLHEYLQLLFSYGLIENVSDIFGYYNLSENAFNAARIAPLFLIRAGGLDVDARNRMFNPGGDGVYQTGRYDYYPYVGKYFFLSGSGSAGGGSAKYNYLFSDSDAYIAYSVRCIAR